MIIIERTILLLQRKTMNEINTIMAEIDEFADKRDWGQFHSPKNLAMALSVEAGEIVEEFQWLTEEQSRNLPPETLANVKDEIADVLNYTLRLCSRLDIDPIRAIRAKIVKNGEKYPVEFSKGLAKKYNEL